VLCCVVLCCVACRCVALPCVVLCFVALRCVALCCVVLCCVALCPRSVELVLESQVVSLISETPFRMHNPVLDMIFPFSNKVLLKFFSGSI